MKVKLIEEWATFYVYTRGEEVIYKYNDIEHRCNVQ